MRGTFATHACPDCRKLSDQHTTALAAKDSTIEALERRIDELHWRLGRAYLAAAENEVDAGLWQQRLIHQREVKRKIRERK